MSPLDFEKYSLEILKSNVRGFENVKFQHDVKIETDDGNYQIDGFIEFEVMGVKYKTLVECKHYKKPISREVVQKVYDNLRALGAQKGIIISTSNFQSGAILYARKHGIALIQMTEAGEQYCTRAYNVIVNHPRVPSNGGNTYIGVMIGCGENGIGVTCSYLSGNSDTLYNFLKSM
jgi:Restriction endonuclease